MTEAQIVELLYRTGHLLHPFGQAEKVLDLPEPPQPQDDLPDSTKASLAQIGLKDTKPAIQSYQHFLTLNLEPLIARHHPQRASISPIIDGDIGPATAELFDLPRCGMPDYGPASAPKAVGSGQWRECHGMTGFHGVVIKIVAAIPEHMKAPFGRWTVWDEVKHLEKVRYGEMGARIWFSDDKDLPPTFNGSNHQLERATFNGGRSYIGLSPIGQGQQCGSRPINNLVDATYLRSSEPSDRKCLLLANLWSHEDGHAWGWGHTSGGLMNPGILPVANSFNGDPSESRAKQAMGGVAVPGWPDFGPTPGPGPDPGPPPDITIREIVAGSLTEMKTPEGDIHTFAVRLKK